MKYEQAKERTMHLFSKMDHNAKGRGHFDCFRRHRDESSWAEIRNQDFDKFDEEYGRYLETRNELMNSSWGLTLKALVQKVRLTPEFQALKEDWNK